MSVNGLQPVLTFSLMFAIHLLLFSRKFVIFSNVFTEVCNVC